MTKEQGNSLEALYQNCLSHAVKHGADVNFWVKTTVAFYRLTDAAHDQELTKKAVDYYMLLQNEFCEALKGVKS